MEKELKCKVIILPTENATTLWKNTDTNNLSSYFKPQQGGGNYPEVINHYLYLVSDREINSNDLAYDTYNKEIIKAPIGGFISGLSIKRVEASTDSSLELPLIDNEFIMEYVKANGKIDEVNVEMEVSGINSSNQTTYRIKINEDNTVIIHSIPIKTYTLEDMKSVHAYGCRFMFDKKSLTKREREENFNKWIEENSNITF